MDECDLATHVGEVDHRLKDMAALYPSIILGSKDWSSVSYQGK